MGSTTQEEEERQVSQVKSKKSNPVVWIMWNQSLAEATKKILSKTLQTITCWSQIHSSHSLILIAPVVCMESQAHYHLIKVFQGLSINYW